MGFQVATSYEEVKGCNVDTLKAWFRENKLPVGGKKEQLIQKVV
jgi:hypothetical protein